MRGQVINASVQLIVEDCFRCGVLFAIPSDLRKQLLDDRSRSFWCPNGHPQHYIGKTDEQKQRERAERLERQLANRDEDLRSTRASLIATKGVLTRTRKRVANGVCPCCNRSFANLQRHMDGQHPDYISEHT